MIGDPNSTLNFAMSGSILGVNDRGTYTAVPKADGGYDIFHVLPDGYTVEQSSFQDAGVALNKDFSAYTSGQPQYAGDTGTPISGGTGGTGPTPEQIAQINEWYDRQLAALERNKQTGLSNFDTQLGDLATTEKNLGTQRDTGINTNAGYFNRISPDAYQSQQEVYNKKILDAYNEGITTVGQNRAKIGKAKENYMLDVADQLYNLNMDKTQSLAGTGGSGGTSDYGVNDYGSYLQGDNALQTNYANSALQSAGAQGYQPQQAKTGGNSVLQAGYSFLSKPQNALSAIPGVGPLAAYLYNYGK